MKFIIKKCTTLVNMYYIALVNNINEFGFINDSLTARYLGLTKDKYQNILKSHNAIKPINCIDYYFKSKKDAEETIKILELYLIMEKLTK